MKTKMFTILCLIALSLCAQSVSAQNYYIETTAFDYYLAAPGDKTTRYIYNESNSKPVLIFESFSDSMNISVIDYNNKDSVIKQTNLILWVDKLHKYRYLTNAKMDEKSFQYIKQEILYLLK